LATMNYRIGSENTFRYFLRAGKTIFLLACLDLLAGCGSSSKQCVGPLPLCNNGSTIQSVAVSSPSTTLGVDATMQFAATGHYRNGSTADITTEVLWSTDDALIVLIGLNGVAIGENPGTVNVTAGAGSITGFEVVTVPD
jgi:hypothetical protein